MKDLGLRIGLVVMCAAIAAQADTLPPWARGSDGTTYSVWNFITNNLNPAPDVVYNPYGTASASINYNPPFGTGWYDTNSNYGSVQGFWDIANGSITLTVPIAPPNGSYPETNQIQITYWSDISAAPTLSVANGTQIGSTVTIPGVNPSGPGQWFTDVTTWLISPGTTPDIITILGDQSTGSVIDQVVVDTLTVPEPTTISLVALGVAAFAGAFFRRRSSSR